jgi:hypothetical protein
MELVGPEDWAAFMVPETLQDINTTVSRVPDSSIAAGRLGSSVDSHKQRMTTDLDLQTRHASYMQEHCQTELSRLLYSFTSETVHFASLSPSWSTDARLEERDIAGIAGDRSMLLSQLSTLCKALSSRFCKSILHFPVSIGVRMCVS